MLQKKELHSKKIDQLKLKEELKKFEGDLKKLDINKSKEDNPITKNFFDDQKGQKIKIEFETKNPKSILKKNIPKKNEVIIEEVHEEDKI